MVTIIPYQPRWPEEFRVIAAGMRSALGDLALRIDHIGSTSVPGLAAKDTIDVQISVAALDENLIAALTSIGYRLHPTTRNDHRPSHATGPDSDWQKLYFNQPVEQRKTNTHVRVLGRPNQRYPLLFRDYLRAHPATAGAYAQLKYQLAANLADLENYSDVKDPAVDLIYFAAEDWARITGWQLGESDA